MLAKRPARDRAKYDVGRARSGKKLNPRICVVCPRSAIKLIDQAADKQVESRSDWIRGQLAIAVAQKLGLDETEMVALFDSVG